MNNLKKLSAFFLILISLIGGGYYFLGKNQSILQMYIEPIGGLSPNQDALEKIESLISPFGHKVKISTKALNGGIAQVETHKAITDYNMAIVSPFVYFENQAIQDEFEAIYTASGDPFKQCFNEVKLFTSKTSAIDRLEQLNNKNIVINPPGKKIALLLARELKKSKIKFDTVYLNKDKRWIDENLKNKNIAAVMTLFPNSKEDEKTPSVLQASRKKSNLKQILHTNNQIPCKFFIIQKKLPAKLKNEIASTLKKKLDSGEYLINFKESMNLASLEEINQEDVSTIRSSVDELRGFRIEDYAKYIVGE